MTAFRPSKLGKIISSQIEAEAKLNLTPVLREGLEQPVLYCTL